MSTVSTHEKRVIPDRLGTPFRRIVASWEVLLFAVAVLIFIFIRSPRLFPRCLEPFGRHLQLHRKGDDCLRHGAARHIG